MNEIPTKWNTASLHIIHEFTQLISLHCSVSMLCSLKENIIKIHCYFSMAKHIFLFHAILIVLKCAWIPITLLCMGKEFCGRNTQNQQSLCPRDLTSYLSHIFSALCKVRVFKCEKTRDQESCIEPWWAHCWSILSSSDFFISRRKQ